MGIYTSIRKYVFRCDRRRLLDNYHNNFHMHIPFDLWEITVGLWSHMCTRPNGQGSTWQHCKKSIWLLFETDIFACLHSIWWQWIIIGKWWYYFPSFFFSGSQGVYHALLCPSTPQEVGGWGGQVFYLFNTMRRARHTLLADFLIMTDLHQMLLFQPWFLCV